MGSDEMMAALMKEIKAELAAQGMEQQQLADAMGMSRSAISHYMQGHRFMTTATFLKAATALNLPPSVLIGRAEARLRGEGS